MMGRFFSETRASMSVVVGLSIIPILVAGGAALDLERAINARTILQSSLDAAALYAAGLPSSTTAASLTTAAQNYVTANYSDAGEAVLSNFKVTTDATSLTASGTVTMNTYMMTLVGIDTLTVNASSTVKRQGAKLQVAMVLDNTGSMASSGKLPAEIAAANSLVSQLKALVVNPGDVYVSVVPFVDVVNVGSSNSSANWLTWADYGSCNVTTSSWWGGSSTQRLAVYTKQQCTLNGGTWTAYASSARSSWGGCVTDRGGVTGPDAGNYDSNNATPNPSVPASLFAATDAYGTGCPQQVSGLSYNWTAITSQINNMVANGTTNQNIGLQHGWMTLTGGGPYTVPAVNPSDTYIKAVVLLTDGLNNVNHWYYGDQTSIDARQTLTCNAMKAQGIIIYTIEISTDGTPLSPLLQNCATDASHFFYLTNASQVVTTFNNIGNNLGKMYLSQ